MSSELKANTEKCEVFFSGVSESLQDEMYKELRIVNRDLPFMYLGVSLPSRKLKYVDCQVLVSQIVKPIIRKVEAVCRTLLWTCSDMKYGKAPIAWEYYVFLLDMVDLILETL